ncbi:Gar1/Naf1 RNA binding region-domain-containing protein [Astrocystis sublimbata]|nr:Gar1/Naf1 RNA binding region-domain-containing protein [Astrocystis sublimbata]
MSAFQIPGLGSLVPTKDNAQTQIPSSVNDQVAAKESQPATVNPISAPQPVAAAAMGDGDQMVVDHPPSPPSLTSGLEALLGGLDPLPEVKPEVKSEVKPAPIEPVAAASSALPDTTGPILSGASNAAQPGGEPQTTNDNGEDHPEWEVDSSPYESSSESSSSDDSNDDSEDEKDYQILGPEETARILMEMDGGSDDEGDGKGKGSGSGQVRTKNEQTEAIIPRPEVQITPEMQIVELGSIEHFVGNTAVIKANTTGEYQVLDTGSVLCLADRTVIAALADVIAAVREPRYTAAFASEEEIKSLGLEVGTTIFYPPVLASLGLTEVLKANKGTDASNWHDEEVAEDEMEFSDDEKEAEYKRQLKAKKRARGGRDGGGGRGGRNDTPTTGTAAAPNVLKYDDDDDEDGPYRPLARPTGFGQGQPPHGGDEPFSNHGGAHRGNRGDFRGRGGRGRGGRGNRGGNSRGGYSLPPRPQGQGGHAGQGVQSFQQPPAQQFNILPPPPPIPMNGQPYPAFQSPQSNGQQAHQQPTQQYNFPWPQNAHQGFFPPPPPPPQFNGQSNTNGMLFDPNFLAALQRQVQSQTQGQQNMQTNQWNGQNGQNGQSNTQWPGQGGQG